MNLPIGCEHGKCSNSAHTSIFSINLPQTPRIHPYSIGNHIFGGHLNESQRHKLEDTKLPGDYIYNNFNDAQSGIILLFELIVVNNWMVNVNL